MNDNRIHPFESTAAQSLLPAPAIDAKTGCRNSRSGDSANIAAPGFIYGTASLPRGC